MISRKRRHNHDNTGLSRSQLWERRLCTERRYLLREGSEDDTYSTRKIIILGLVRAALRLTGLYKRGLANAHELALHWITVTIQGLPAGLEGFRVLHLSDLHFSRRQPSFADAYARVLAGVAADVCCITGDFRFGHYGPSGHVLTQLPRVLDAVRIRYGTYAVLGNHDLGDLVAGLRPLGVQVLMNNGVSLPVNGATLWVGGVDDPQMFRCESVPLALRGKPDDAFVLFLCHTPISAQKAAAAGAHLYLCGHTHAGQIRFPWWGAVETNCPGAPRSHIHGLWQHNGMTGYTSAGLGTTDLPVRFNCPPEAVVITLRSGGGRASREL